MVWNGLHWLSIGGQWRALVNMVTTFRVQYMKGFLKYVVKKDAVPCI